MTFHRIVQPLLWLWASPYTLLGLTVGLCGLCSRGRVQFGPGAIEFHGGAVRWFLERTPGGLASAMTLGHVVLGRNAAALDSCRNHELVHVRQYERWGPLFGPAYLGCSLVLWLRRRDAYYENPFERQAYDEAG